MKGTSCYSAHDRKPHLQCFIPPGTSWQRPLPTVLGLPRCGTSVRTTAPQLIRDAQRDHMIVLQSFRENRPPSQATENSSGAGSAKLRSVELGSGSKLVSSTWLGQPVASFTDRQTAGVLSSALSGRLG